MIILVAGLTHEATSVGYGYMLLKYCKSMGKARAVQFYGNKTIQCSVPDESN